ncbi:hypothetical protein [Salicibibacter cibarius]|nr:hypothetical protein [Salicibibacter cibarius]
MNDTVERRYAYNILLEFSEEIYFRLTLILCGKDVAAQLAN